MLKNVVLPAPFGPIRLTIDRCGIVKSRSLTASRPPNSFRTSLATSRSPVVSDWLILSGAPASALVSRASSSSRDSAGSSAFTRSRFIGAAHLVEGLVERAARTLLDLPLAAALGDQADGTEQHHQHDDHPVDAELVLGHVDLVAGRKDVRVQPGADVGKPLHVQPREDRPGKHDSPDAAHAAENDHAEEENREVEVELDWEGARVEGRDVSPGGPAEEGADRVGPRLRPHQRDAHRPGRRLVLADRDPGAAQTRVSKADRAEDGQ